MAKKGAKGPAPRRYVHDGKRSQTLTMSKLLTDTASSNVLLSNQLRALGLYPADTVGDGNCLFRALSDQLYGSPSKHAELRQLICDWIYKHKSRYEPFVEDERGLDEHLRCMRENGTYGGHMELSAFAHFTRRNVKVVQPGLVYVIEWASGWESIAGEDAAVSSAQSVATGPTSSSPVSDSDTSPTSASTSSSVITRRRSLRAISGKEIDKQRRREQAEKGKKVKTGKHGYYVYEEVTSDDEEQDAAKGVAESRARMSETASSESGRAPPTPASSVSPESSGDTIYVAYHDWEHFSSIRNLQGPHTGLPMVRERPAETVTPSMIADREREALKERDREKKKERKAMASGKPKREAVPTTPAKEPGLKVKLRIPPRTNSSTSTIASAPPLSTASNASFSSALTELSTTESAMSVDTALPQPGPPSSSISSSLHAASQRTDPVAIPLPTSRSASPFPSASSTISSADSSASSSNLSSNLVYPSTPSRSPLSMEVGTGLVTSYHARQAHLQPALRSTPVKPVEGEGSGHQSPKRSFDESSGAEEGEASEDGGGKRRRAASQLRGGVSRGATPAIDPVPGDGVDVSMRLSDEEDEDDGEDDDDGAGDEGKGVSNLPPAAMRKLKPKHERILSSARAGGKQLTRRQRKQLGLPKKGNGSELVSGDIAPRGKGTGRIVIPGGKSRGWEDLVGNGKPESQEWIMNGTGRLDVRGFRELKI